MQADNLCQRDNKAYISCAKQTDNKHTKQHKIYVLYNHFANSTLKLFIGQAPVIIRIIEVMCNG